MSVYNYHIHADKKLHELTHVVCILFLLLCTTNDFLLSSFLVRSKSFNTRTTHYLEEDKKRTNKRITGKNKKKEVEIAWNATAVSHTFWEFLNENSIRYPCSQHGGNPSVQSRTYQETIILNIYSEIL